MIVPINHSHFQNKEDNDDFIDAFLHQSTEEVEGESNKVGFY